MTRGVPPKVGFGAKAAHRARLRELGFKHGYEGTPKSSDDPEYLTSYRRGAERRAEEDK